MKQIVAREQVVLGPARCLGLALTGMSYRMFRSGVTVSILALAVAFLVHMLSYGILAQETQTQSYAELAESRELGERVTRLGVADTEAQILSELATGDALRLAEYRVWGGVSDERFEAARATAAHLHGLGLFLEALPPAERTVLLGDHTPGELYARLTEAGRVARFIEQLDSMRIRPPGLDAPALSRLFLEQRPDLVAVAAAIARGHARAIERIKTAYPGKSAAELSREIPEGFVENLQAAGFSLAVERVPALQAFVTQQAELQHLGRLLLGSEVRAAVSRKTRLAPGDVSFEALFDHVHDVNTAAWLTATLHEVDPSFNLSAERVSFLFDDARRQRRLMAVTGGEAPAETPSVFGLTEKNQWLIALSFLVCVVGVANAMLMSVTERFTEIATMKCLGAMDRFILLMFVFEAVIQGLLGGLVGIVIGVLLALIRGLVEFGGLLVAAVGALGELGLAVVVSLLVGVLLAAVAAMAPAWIAARLAPMEAMRVD